MPERPNTALPEGTHRHEQTDVRSPFLAWLALALVLSLVAMQPALLGVYHLLAKLRAAQQPAVTPLAVHQAPPNPRLQSSPTEDLQQLRADEARLLGGYGWVDREHVVVRIPIERAMDLVLERGLPKPATGAGEPRSKQAEIEEREETRPETDEPADKMPAVDEADDPESRETPKPKGQRTQ